MSFPLFIFTLLGFVLSVFIAFLIYSIFYPEAISNPLIIWTNFYSNLVVLKHKHDDYLILKQEKLLEQQEIIKRNQEEKDKVVCRICNKYFEGKEVNGVKTLYYA